MIRLRTLGECAIEVGARRIGPDAGHVFAVLLYLAVERGKQIGRGTLIEHFWPSASEANARHCLRQTVYKLRQLGAPVESTPSHVELPVSAVTGDYLQLAEGGRVDVEALRVGGAAFGEFLAGYAPAFSPAFAEWLESKRDFVHGHVRRALSTALVECRSAHRWADVEAVARCFLQIDPLNEEATLALAEATALTGSKAQAISMLDRFVAELGPDAGDIRLPATLLRKRIAERLPARRYGSASEELFVGREGDLAVLGGLLREARAGRGQACLVWGDPGIGKSRLAAECAKGATLQGVRVQRVACHASDVARPLSAFMDVVPLLQTLPGALGCSPESVAYLRRLTQHDPDAPRSDDVQESAYLYGRIRRALLDLVDAVADEAPLILLVEDVHWLDAQSWDVLRETIEWADHRRLFVLLTSRTAMPTQLPSPLLPRRLVTHHLGSLDGTASVKLLDAIAAEHRRALDSDFRAWCVSVSEGNPLFLRELANKWVDTGDLSQVPATLASVIGERLSSIRPLSMRLLQASAVLGKNSTFERLEAVTDYKRFELLDAVEELEAVGLLIASGSGIHPRHDLIARASLRDLKEGTTRLLHRNAARVLETEIEQTKGVTLLWDFAEHCHEAGDPDRAAKVILAVGSHLIAVGLPEEATIVYRTALQRAVDPEPRVPLLEGLCMSLHFRGIWGELRVALRELLDARIQLAPLSSTHSDEEILFIEAEWHTGHEARSILDRLMSCVNDDAADVDHRLTAALVALRVADNQVDHETFRKAFDAVIGLGDGIEDHEASVLGAQIIFHTTVGDARLATEFGAKLVARERARGTPRSLARALRYSSMSLRFVGELQRAEAHLLEALNLAERFHLASAAMAAAETLCHLALEREDTPTARYWHTRAMGWSTVSDDRFIADELGYAAARIALAEGDYETARSLANWDVDAMESDTDLRRRIALFTLWLLLHNANLGERDWQRHIESVLRLYSYTRERGIQDFCVYCLCHTLVSRHKTEMAYSLLTEYATIYRREISPLPCYLERLVRDRDAGNQPFKKRPL